MWGAWTAALGATGATAMCDSSQAALDRAKRRKERDLTERRGWEEVGSVECKQCRTLRSEVASR